MKNPLFEMIENLMEREVEEDETTEEDDEGKVIEMNEVNGIWQKDEQEK